MREHIPSACITKSRGKNPDVRVSESDLLMLREAAVLLRAHVARLGDSVVAMFGDFEIAPVAAARLRLFHPGGSRFNGFRVGPHYTALDEDDMRLIVAHLPSARLLRNGPQTIVEVGDADFVMLLGTAEEASRWSGSAPPLVGSPAQSRKEFFRQVATLKRMARQRP